MNIDDEKMREAMDGVFDYYMQCFGKDCRGENLEIDEENKRLVPFGSRWGNGDFEDHPAFYEPALELLRRCLYEDHNKVRVYMGEFINGYEKVKEGYFGKELPSNSAISTVCFSFIEFFNRIQYLLDTYDAIPIYRGKPYRFSCKVQKETKTTLFLSFIKAETEDEKKKILSELHKEIDGKKGKFAAIPLFAKVDIGTVTIPSFGKFKEEFNTAYIFKSEYYRYKKTMLDSKSDPDFKFYCDKLKKVLE